MEVPLRHLEKLFKETVLTRLTFDLTDLSQANTYTLEASGIEFKGFIDLSYLGRLKAKGVQKVSVCVPREALQKLRTLFPGVYPTAQFEESQNAIRSRLELIDKLNKISKRRRELLLIEELIARDSADRERVFIKSQTLINDVFFKKLATRPDAPERLQVSYNEEGILIYVANPVENVKLRIDLISLASMTNFPIHFAESAAQAIEMFHGERPRLVILTELDKQYESKEVFMAMQKHDPFFHYLVYNESPSGKREEELNRILSLYNDDYQSKYDSYTMDKAKNKPILDNEKKAPIMARIEALRQNYSRKAHVELAYYLHRAAAHYNVTTLENILSKITVSG